MSAAYRLTGYVEFLPVPSGFISPVFLHDGKYYLQVTGKSRLIERFVAVSGEQAVINPPAPYIAFVGEECLYGFKRLDEIVFGYSNALHKYFNESVVLLEATATLRQCIGEFLSATSMPHLYDSREPLGLRRKSEKALRNAFTRVAIIDQDPRRRESTSRFINGFERYGVVFEGAAGKDLINLAQLPIHPDILLLDAELYDFGFDSIDWLGVNNLRLKVILCGNLPKNKKVMRKIRRVATAFLPSVAKPERIQKLLDQVAIQKAFWDDSHRVFRPWQYYLDRQKHLGLRERQFLQLISTNLSEEEIEREMNFDRLEIQGIKNRLQKLFNLSSRPELIRFAAENGIFISEDGN